LFINQIKNGEALTITNPLMTRFMMTLDSAVDLVLFSFENAKQGDLYVQKAPAATVKTLAEALMRIYNKVVPIKVIGTRHGEKLFETLVNKEDMAKAEDLGEYYRIPADTRNLNYEQFFSEGNSEIEEFDDYHSHNTNQLDIDGMVNLLLKLEIVQKDINR
jgi:UDP-glucose 4-epimerase